MKPGKTGIKRIIDAAGYSFQGICFAWRNEAAFRQECILAVVLIPLAFFLGETTAQTILLITPIFLVLVVELINSAIEAVVDRIGDEPHSLSGAAKDIGSAAVFVCLVLLVFIWLMVFFERFDMPSLKF